MQRRVVMYSDFNEACDSSLLCCSHTYQLSAAFSQRRAETLWNKEVMEAQEDISS